MTIDHPLDGDRPGDAGLRVEVRVRDAVHPSAQEPIADVRARVDELARAGHLDDAETVVWGRHLPLETDGDTGAVLEPFRRFRAWALRTGVDLEPAFRVHETSTLGGEAAYSVVTVPLVCVAVYDGADVRAVYPHADAEGVVTVERGLERIAAGRLDAQTSGTPKQ